MVGLLFGGMGDVGRRVERMGKGEEGRIDV